MSKICPECKGNGYLRTEMNKLNLGEIQLQTIGNENDIVIRVQGKKEISKER